MRDDEERMSGTAVLLGMGLILLGAALGLVVYGGGALLGVW